MSRRIDLSLFRGDDSDEDDGSTLTAELNPLKSKTLSYGVTKKTKRDLELEAERKKRQEEEEATRLALEEYSQAFSGPGHRAPAGSGGWKSQSRGFVRAGDTAIYNPPRGSAAPALQASTTWSAPVRLPSPPPPPKPRGKRAMDAFLEEIKGV
ncbi:uncharacterized protein EHS24_001840 [Apiotrichum porosum]|uniref:Uncharacterized protein n=1 Tax=Apiotrichum porosum TaxID=105984 RepID=A0A427XJJ5_9TREE|nr:uncharacterized protein EHS24_001840 [Apiotrichum porosum]RSH78917.1 hypothetical protein EHS24_001840 [Apiotrichum porosum]